MIACSLHALFSLTQRRCRTECSVLLFRGGRYVGGWPNLHWRLSVARNRRGWLHFTNCLFLPSSKVQHPKDIFAWLQTLVVCASDRVVWKLLKSGVHSALLDLALSCQSVFPIIRWCSVFALQHAEDTVAHASSCVCLQRMDRDSGQSVSAFSRRTLSPAPAVLGAFRVPLFSTFRWCVRSAKSLALIFGGQVLSTNMLH